MNALAQMLPKPSMTGIFALLGIAGFSLCSCVSPWDNSRSDSRPTRDAHTGHRWEAWHTKLRCLRGVYQASGASSLLVVMPVVEMSSKKRRVASYTVYRMHDDAAHDRWNHTEEKGLWMDGAALRDRNGKLRYRLDLPDDHRGATCIEDVHSGQRFMKQRTSVQYEKCVLVPEEFVAQAKEACYMKQIVPGSEAQCSPSAISGVYCYDTADDDTLALRSRTPHSPHDMIIMLPCQNEREFSLLHLRDKGEDGEAAGIPTPYGFQYTGASLERIDHLTMRDGYVRTASGTPVCSIQVSGGKVIGLWRLHDNGQHLYYTKQTITAPCPS